MFKLIYYLFIAFIILIAICLAGSMLPIPENYKIMIVQSGSMAPAIKTGSIVIVKPSPDYKVGDIITFGDFSRTKIPTTHRIVEVKNENGEISYITKGDANNAPDQKEVLEKEIIGKELFNIPYFGFVVAFAQKPIGFALLIVFPAMIVILDELKNIWKELKKMKDKKIENKKADSNPIIQEQSFDYEIKKENKKPPIITDIVKKN